MKYCKPEPIEWNSDGLAFFSSFLRRDLPAKLMSGNGKLGLEDTLTKGICWIEIFAFCHGARKTRLTGCVLRCQL